MLPPEDEEDSSFVQVIQELASIDGVDGLITMFYENLWTLCDHLKRNTNRISAISILSIRKLLFSLKHLQEKGRYKIGLNFD